MISNDKLIRRLNGGILIVFACCMPNLVLSCPLPIHIEKLAQRSCKSYAGADIASFGGELPYANSEEDERTVVVVAYAKENDELFRKAIKIESRIKNEKTELTSPPFPALIEERHPMPEQGLAALQKKGWQISADVIGYRGKGSQAGPSTLCLLALSKKKHPGIAVATCSLYFSESTDKFNAILDQISGEIIRIPTTK